MNRHLLSTIAICAAFVFGAGFYVGAWFGVTTSPAAYDARIIERRLQEVFCEQTLKNKLLTTCKVD